MTITHINGKELELTKEIALLYGELNAERLFSKQAMDAVNEIAAQRDAARAELYEGKHCQCGYDDVCQFAREADKLKAEIAASDEENKRLLSANVDVITHFDAIKADYDTIKAELAESVRLLAIIFDSYENGVQCYEEPDDATGYLGNAVRLDDDDFAAAVNLLNRLSPRGAKEKTE